VSLKNERGTQLRWNWKLEKGNEENARRRSGKIDIIYCISVKMYICKG